MLYVALAQLAVIAGLVAALLIVVRDHGRREAEHACELERAHARTSVELLELANRVQHPQFFQPPPRGDDGGPTVQEPELDGFELAGRHAEFADEFERLLDVEED